MRPVTRNNPGYAPPATVRINTQSIRTHLATEGINPQPGTAGDYDVQTLLAFLSQMTANNYGAPDWSNPNITVNQKFLIPQLIKIFSGSGAAAYGNARGALIENFGQLCDYCGLPVFDSSLAIEHTLPKAQFPGEMIAYHNFFLACPNCNSVKGSRPTFRDGLNWLINHGNPNPTYPQLLQGTFDLSIWPTDANAYVRFGLFLVEYGQQQAIPMQNAFNTNNTYLSSANNQVRAQVAGFQNPILVYTSLSPLGNGDNLARGNNFVNLVGLNNTVPGSYSDRRVTNRTIAFFSALSAAGSLIAMFNSDPDPNKPLFFTLFHQVAQNVRTAGFFEIWTAVFYMVSPPNNQYSLYTILVQSCTDQTAPLYYIPGTNAAGFPVN